MQHLRQDFSTDCTPADAIPARPVFSVCGSKSGPKLVVGGSRNQIAKLASDLRAVPSLPYLSGEITLIVATPDAGIPDADDILMLHELSGKAAYWTTLARATRLGMIAGRGIPQGWLAA